MVFPWIKWSLLEQPGYFHAPILTLGKLSRLGSAHSAPWHLTTDPVWQSILKDYTHRQKNGGNPYVGRISPRLTLNGCFAWHVTRNISIGLRTLLPSPQFLPQHNKTLETFLQSSSPPTQLFQTSTRNFTGPTGWMK